LLTRRTAKGRLSRYPSVRNSALGGVHFPKLSLYILSALFFFLPTAATAADETTPAGIARNQSLYLPMRDGVKIAVDVWLPPTLQPNQKVPALLKMTSYWRAIGLAERTGAFRVLGAVGVVPTEDFN